jgi:glycosyltransferase involved in cell wall biosynthesis
VSEWGWIGEVTKRFVELSRREGPFHVLHSRLNPHVSHLAALQVTREIPSCPWCAYFSDPWPHSLYPDSYRFTVGPVSRVRLEAVLNAMIARSDSLVFPADRLKTHLLNGRREPARDKAFVAPHLSRSDSLVAAPQTRPHLVIRHAGFLMKERRIDTVYAALRRLRRSRPDVYRALRLEFAGRYVNDTTPVPPDDLRYVIRFFPYMHSEAIPDWLAHADVLLLIEAKMREGIFFPAKLAEYLGFRRPILALSPPIGTISDLLSDSGTLIVEPDDEVSIAEALCTLSDEWRSGALPFRTPTNRHRWMVSADAVVPIYEQAFDAAASRRRAASASS